MNDTSEANVLIAQDPREQARLAATLLRAFSRSVLLRKKHFDVVFSGGSTPVALYRLLASEYRSSVAWDRFRFFWADERDVPPDDPESNFRLVNETLLGPLGIRDENIFPIPARRVLAGHSGSRGTAEKAALAYEETLRRLFSISPAFDFVCLGIGDDGHTASLFPDARQAWESAEREGHWVAAPWVPHLRGYRITLLPCALNRGSKVCFLVSGTGKAEILRKILEPPVPDGVLYPPQIIHSRQGKAFWLIDGAAASRLGFSQAA